MAQSASGCATLDTTLVDAPKAPVDRRVLIGLLLALTVLLHVVTAGWGPIRNGAEGIAAATARSVIETNGGWLRPSFASQEIVPDDWLSMWLTAASFQILGPTEFAARLPQALASLLMVWWVFLIGERLGGTWRGMSAGLIATTCIGVFVHANTAGSGTLWAAMITGAFYWLCCGLEQAQKPQGRRSAFSWFWWFMALAVLASDWDGMGYPAVIIGALLICFRTARLRLAKLPINGGIVALLLAAGLRLWLTSGDKPDESLPAATFAESCWFLFPWSAMIAVPFLLRWKKVLRMEEMEPSDALPWMWLVASGLALVVFQTSTTEWPQPIALLWPAFALCAAVTWERITSGMRLVGVGLLVAASVTGLFVMPLCVGEEMASALRPVWWLSCGVVIGFATVALFFAARGQSRAALLAVSAAVIPLGFNLLDAHKHVAERTSGRSLAESFLPATHEKDVLYTNEKPATISSFLFYWRGDVKPEDQIVPARNALLLVPRNSADRRGRPVSENASHVLFSLQETGK